MSSHQDYLKAGSILTSRSDLERFAKSEDDLLKVRVAANSSAPEGILTELSVDPNIEVRVEVAQNPSAPVKVLEELARDQSIDVRMAVAGATYTPNHVLSELIEDENIYVQEMAKETLERIMERSSALAGKDGDDIEDLRRIEAFLCRELQARRRGLAKLRKDISESQISDAAGELLPKELIEKFESNSANVEAAFEKLKRASASAFEEMKVGLDDSMEHLDNAWNSLSDSFNRALKKYSDTLDSDQ